MGSVEDRAKRDGKKQDPEPEAPEAEESDANLVISIEDELIGYQETNYDPPKPRLRDRLRRFFGGK